MSTATVPAKKSSPTKQPANLREVTDSILSASKTTKEARGKLRNWIARHPQKARIGGDWQEDILGIVVSGLISEVQNRRMRSIDFELDADEAKQKARRNGSSSPNRTLQATAATAGVNGKSLMFQYWFGGKQLAYCTKEDLLKVAEDEGAKGIGHIRVRLFVQGIAAKIPSKKTAFKYWNDAALEELRKQIKDKAKEALKI